MILKTDREKTAHLLRRFALGASEAELDYYLGSSGKLGDAIARLLDYEKVEDDFPLGFDDLQVQADRPVPMPAVVGWWASRMLYTRRPLEEKMTLFWHDHFATSAEKVRAAPAMFGQNQILRQHCLGGFREMLHAVSKDPAMLFWLDNQFNVRGKPNENFAREVMELFTLGIGHYTEKDVQEAARAFTGWGIGRAGAPGARPQNQVRGNTAFVFRPFQHDSGSKTVLGKTGNLTGEDVLDHLCTLPRTSEYLVTKMWAWFAYPNPEPKLVKRLADGFRKNDLSLRWLTKTIMQAPEFYSDKAVRGVYKSPVDFAIVAARQLGVSRMVESAAQLNPRTALGPGNALAQTLKNLGMHLLYPPDVDGWAGGASWISTATMLERIRFADALFLGRAVNRGRLRPLPAFALIGDAGGAAQSVDRLLTLLDVTLPKEKRQAVIQAARDAGGDSITQANANEVAAAITRMIFATPEFQFA